MKKSNFKKKLSLDKKVISQLDDAQLKHVKGGLMRDALAYDDSCCETNTCQTHTCATHTCQTHTC